MGESGVGDCNGILLTGDGAIVVFDVTCSRLEGNWGAGCENSVFLHAVFFIDNVVEGAVTESRNQRLFVAEGDEFW